MMGYNQDQAPEEALVKCSRCDGTGKDKRLKNTDPSGNGISGYQVCPRCRGSGKTDWVSNITGSNDIERWSGYSGYTGTSGGPGVSGAPGSSGFTVISGFLFSGVSGMSGVIGNSKPPIPTLTTPASKTLVTFPSVPKPDKRSKLLQKVRDNAIQKINDLLGGL
jgi:hypothetical protein